MKLSKDTTEVKMKKIKVSRASIERKTIKTKRSGNPQPVRKTVKPPIRPKVLRKTLAIRKSPPLKRDPESMLPNICVRPDFPLVVSGYTIDSHIGDYYKRASHRLSNSLLRFDLPHIIFPLKSTDDWANNCALKQTLILYVLENMRCPVLWIDIDGEVFNFPDAFLKPDFDIALVNYDGHWLTGTMFLSPKTTDFVREWRKFTKPSEPDEVSLLHLYNNSDNGLKLRMLPRKYNEIVHTRTDVSRIIVGHYIRADVAPNRKDGQGNPLKAVPLPK